MTQLVANRREYISFLTTGFVGSVAGCGQLESGCGDDRQGDLRILVVPDDIDSTPEAEAQEIAATTTVECPTNGNVLFQETETFTQTASSTPSPRRYVDVYATDAFRLIFDVRDGPTKTEEHRLDGGSILEMEITYRVNDSIEFSIEGAVVP